MVDRDNATSQDPLSAHALAVAEASAQPPNWTGLVSHRVDIYLHQQPIIILATHVFFSPFN